jgi:hypothetical protein
MPTPDILWELNYHQRFPWRSAADTPAVSWPEGKRLALYVAINLEHFAFGCQEERSSHRRQINSIFSTIAGEITGTGLAPGIWPICLLN